MRWSGKAARAQGAAQQTTGEVLPHGTNRFTVERQIATLGERAAQAGISRRTQQRTQQTTGDVLPIGGDGSNQHLRVAQITQPSPQATPGGAGGAVGI
jgi:hypothetical protein